MTAFCPWPLQRMHSSVCLIQGEGLKVETRVQYHIMTVPRSGLVEGDA